MKLEFLSILFIGVVTPSILYAQSSGTKNRVSTTEFRENTYVEGNENTIAAAVVVSNPGAPVVAATKVVQGDLTIIGDNNSYAPCSVQVESEGEYHTNCERKDTTIIGDDNTEISGAVIHSDE